MKCPDFPISLPRLFSSILIIAASSIIFPSAASLEDLLEDHRNGQLRRHLRKIFVDPMTGKADWGLVLQNGRIVGVYSRSTQSPIRRAGFDLAEERFQQALSYADWIFTANALPPLFLN